MAMAAVDFALPSLALEGNVGFYGIRFLAASLSLTGALRAEQSACCCPWVGYCISLPHFPVFF